MRDRNFTTIPECLRHRMSSLSFNSPEQVQGALWFLPVWLVSSGLFAGCVWFGRAAARFTRKDNVKLPVCAFACILIGLAGVFLNMRSCPLPYNLQAALLVVPVYLIAWLMQQFFSNFRHYTVWYGCLISALLLHLTNTSFTFSSIWQACTFRASYFIRSPSLEFTSSFRSPTCPSASDRWQRSLPF